MKLLARLLGYLIGCTVALGQVAAAAVAQPAIEPRAATDVHDKARAINTGGTMGCLEEIGSSPRVAAELFDAGFAAGSILAARATYGKGASNAVYGKTRRFVAPERLEHVLARQFDDAVRFAHQEGEEVPDGTKLFGYGNTVATNAAGPGSGWMGVRFRTQGEVHGAPASTASTGVSQIAVEFRVRGEDVGEQSALIGKLGVNLIHASFYRTGSLPDLLLALSGETRTNGQRGIELRSIRTRGPELAHLDPGTVGVEILKAGFNDHVMMERGAKGAESAEASDVMHGFVPLVYPAGERRAWLDAGKLGAALAGLVSADAKPLKLRELPVVVAGEDQVKAFTEQAKAIEAAGACVLARTTAWTATARFLAESSRSPLLMVVDRSNLAPTVASVSATWHPVEGSGPPQVRYLVAVKDSELGAVVKGPGRASMEQLVNAGAVQVIVEDTGAALVPATRLGALLTAVGAHPPAGATYRLLEPLAKAKAGLSAEQVATLDKLVKAGAMKSGP